MHVHYVSILHHITILSILIFFHDFEKSVGLTLINFNIESTFPLEIP